MAAGGGRTPRPTVCKTLKGTAIALHDQLLTAPAPFTVAGECGAPRGKQSGAGLLGIRVRRNASSKRASEPAPYEPLQAEPPIDGSCGRVRSVVCSRSRARLFFRVADLAPDQLSKAANRLDSLLVVTTWLRKVCLRLLTKKDEIAGFCAPKVTSRPSCRWSQYDAVCGRPQKQRLRRRLRRRQAR